MRWSGRRIVLAVAAAGLLVLLAFGLADRPVLRWLAANFIVAADKTLGAWRFLPPMASWMAMGFVLGALVYFALWEAPKLGRRRLRGLLLALAGGLVVLPVLAGAALTYRNDAFQILHHASGLKPGETRTFAGIEFVWVPPGRFRMGSPEGETGRRDDEGPWMVTLTKGFWLGKYEVTQAQWEAVMGVNPSKFAENGAQRPVENVLWEDCHALIDKLNHSGPGTFRLTTEAEWEYACRAGVAGAYGFGDAPSALDGHAWYTENSDGATHPVGQKAPNAWGLHDMHGNVCEWCQDWYGAYPEGPEMDPAGPPSGQYRVLRGGGWDGDPAACRAGRRRIFIPGYFQRQSDLGLRLARTFSEQDLGRSEPPPPETGNGASRPE